MAAPLRLATGVGCRDGVAQRPTAVVGYAAVGIGGALLAAFIAFLPSFSFVLLGARHFDQLRRNPSVLAFLDGAGPAAIGAIIGSAGPLGLALTEPWQAAVLAAAALLLARSSVVLVLLAAGVLGVVLALLGVGVPGG